MCIEDKICKIKQFGEVISRLIELQVWYRDKDPYYPADKQKQDVLEKGLLSLKSQQDDINTLMKLINKGEEVPKEVIASFTSNADASLAGIENSIETLEERVKQVSEWRSSQFQVADS